MIPNVLNIALSVIPKQDIIYRKYMTQETNELGIMVNVYDEPITVKGSIQPADENTLYKLGIGYADDVYVCHLPANVLSISELQTNDQIIDSDGNEYNIFMLDKWFTYPNQNWNRVLIRRVKNYDG